MITRIENQVFGNFNDSDKIVCYEDLEFIRCRFNGGGFGYRRASDYSQRSCAKNIRIVDCCVRGFGIGPAVLDGVFIQNVNCDLVTVWGALFKHVTIKGRCDKLMIHGIPTSQIISDHVAKCDYWNLCDSFYAGVDWALDIREAEFFDFCIRTRGVPGHLIVRDAETQALVKAEKVREGRWRTVGIESLTGFMFKLLESEGGEDLVIVAPKRNKADFAEVMRDIRLLREAGIAEPD